MQRMLRHDQHRIVGTLAASSRRLVLQVELARGTERATVPFTLVTARTGGWLVQEIGLDQALPPRPRTRDP